MRLKKSTAVKAGIAIYPAFEIINGYINGYEPAKLITNSYILFFIIATITLVPPGKTINSIKKSALPATLFAFFALWISLTAFQSNLAIGDITLLIRSFLFCCVALISLSSIERQDRASFTSLFCYSWWAFTTIAIFLSSVFGFGLYTYETFEAGRKFYFQANNELSIFYSSISTFIIITQKSNVKRALISALSIACFLTIGVKSFALTAAIIATFFFLKSLDRKLPGLTSKVLVVIVPSTIAATLIYLNIEKMAELLVELLGSHSSASSKIVEKANHLGALSAALGERDVLISKAFEVLSPKIGFLELLFGLGFSKYTALYGASFGGEMKFVENDIIDVFFSFGMIGIALYSYIILSILKKFILLSSQSDAYQSASTTACLNALILGALSGHGVLFSFPCLIIAIFIKGSEPTPKHER